MLCLLTMGGIFKVKERKECGALIKKINDELEKNANNVLRTEDLTFSQIGALLELNSALEGQLTLKELEKRLHVAQSTAVGIISRLERKALVQAVGDAGDRRIKIVKITSEGIERVQKANSHRMEAEELLLSGLTETEKSIFYSLLKKVCDTLQ